MKLKAAVSTLVVMLAISLNASITSAAETIVDYYNSIPTKLLEDHKYDLQLKKNIWVTRSCAGYEIKPVVDIKKGYVAITDKGTGGGALRQVLALYRTKAGEQIVGVGITRDDSVKSASTIKFYKPADNQWADVTDDVLPEVDLSLFRNEDYHSKTKGRINQTIAYTPPPDDVERKAILDALRKRWKGVDVIFVVHYLKVNNGWAWIHVLPETRDGKNRFEDESWLMRKNGQWKEVEARNSGIDCEEDPVCSDDKKYYTYLKSKYPSAPPDIFSY